MSDAINKTIHLHSGDPRFCGSQQKPRRFTVNDADVTCPNCTTPLCEYTQEPMMLQEAIDDDDELAQIECGSPYPQWACSCNGGHYQAAFGGSVTLETIANWNP